jgi:uncharacterized protein (DUF1778 family)
MTTEHTARLEARLPASVYALLERAAALQGRTLSDFVVSAAHDAAQRTIQDERIIRQCVEDQTRFAQALIDPPAPNAALARAMRRHARHVEQR